MNNYALKLAYDGTDFMGWQKTPTGPSIEEALEQVLEHILQTPITLQAASRTDRGVHAEGQWVNFLTSIRRDPQALQHSLNALLPPSIRVLALCLVPDTFHPTLHAQAKEYHYRISLGPIQMPLERHMWWHVPYSLDIPKMQTAASHFAGTHDFLSFCNFRKNLAYTDTVRHIEEISLSSPRENHLVISVKGNHFLYKMVRNLVGTLVYVGRGKIAPEAIPAILQARSRPEAGITAPAHGLTLAKIYYPQECIPEL